MLFVCVCMYVWARCRAAEREHCRLRTSKTAYGDDNGDDSTLKLYSFIFLAPTFSVLEQH